jgi:hypothetical protein
MVMQQKTGQPVQFEITEQTRESMSKWINHAELISGDLLFKGQNRTLTNSTPGATFGTQRTPG